jgi:hypothetical protein
LLRAEPVPPTRTAPSPRRKGGGGAFRSVGPGRSRNGAAPARRRRRRHSLVWRPRAGQQRSRQGGGRVRGGTPFRHRGGWPDHDRDRQGRLAVPDTLVQIDGTWRFDVEKGKEELFHRRIGRNELGAIAVCRGIVDAEREYAAVGHDGDDPGIYALKLISDDGLENGLYWPTEEGEEPSPAGEFVAAAAGEGYRRGEGRTPYHGYYYRLLYAQGPHAKGGAREYFKDGLMTEGFAVLAWPADYGSGGITSFMVNQDGVVFQKDLGEETPTVVETIDLFDPDDSWTAVEDEAGLLSDLARAERTRVPRGWPVRVRRPSEIARRR